MIDAALIINLLQRRDFKNIQIHHACRQHLKNKKEIILSKPVFQLLFVQLEHLSHSFIGSHKIFFFLHDQLDTGVTKITRIEVGGTFSRFSFFVRNKKVRNQRVGQKIRRSISSVGKEKNFKNKRTNHCTKSNKKKQVGIAELEKIR